MSILAIIQNLLQRKTLYIYVLTGYYIFWCNDIFDWLIDFDMTQAWPGFPEKRQFLVIASLTHLSPSLLAQVLI